MVKETETNTKNIDIITSNNEKSDKDLKEIIAKNLIKYRKHTGLTQLQVADAINYSDKAVSKWERAEGVPDIFVLKKLAKLYSVTVNDFLVENNIINLPSPMIRKLLITLISMGMVLVVATTVFVMLKITTSLKYTWLSFIVALPIISIIGIVFSAIWFKRIVTFIFSSAFIWTTATVLFMVLTVEFSWMFFIIPIPIQGLLFLWYHLAKSKKARVK